MCRGWKTLKFLARETKFVSCSLVEIENKLHSKYVVRTRYIYEDKLPSRFTLVGVCVFCLLFPVGGGDVWCFFNTTTSICRCCYMKWLPWTMSVANMSFDTKQANLRLSVWFLCRCLLFNLTSWSAKKIAGSGYLNYLLGKDISTTHPPYGCLVQSGHNQGKPYLWQYITSSLAYLWSSD